MNLSEQILSFRYKVDKVWICQLYKEYDYICWARKVKLKPMTIRLTASEKLLGSWCHESRVLSISRKLIEKHPWWVVLEVLKHEMAHQYVDDVFKKEDHHGPLFKKACNVLGVESWASCASLVTDGLVQDKDRPSQDEEKTLRRVEKLLKLAESSNQHEAQLASTKVKSLLDKLQVDWQGSSLSHNHTTKIINHHKKRIESYQVYIGTLLANYFDVRIIYSSTFNAKKNFKCSKWA